MKVERLGFPILNMVHNPGGDWNPGWGVDLWYIYLHEWLIFYGFHVDKHSILGWYGRDRFAKQNRKPATVKWEENLCQKRRRENRELRTRES